MTRSLRTIAAALALPSILACRDASGGPAALTIVPNAEGSNGCSGPDQTFVPPQVPADVTPAGVTIGPASQVTAAAGGELLYATVDGASVVSIDMGQAPPVVEVIVPPGSGAGTVEELLATEGIGAAASLSGIAVLDADRLVVVEQTSNTLLTIARAAPHTIEFYAGLPSIVPGRADGLASSARFSFGSPSQVCPTGDVPPAVFVADPGNHSIRLVRSDLTGLTFVTTIAGSGSPGHDDDEDLADALFDTPTGLSVPCSGSLLVSEVGGHGAGLGHRVRELEIGQPSVFGGFFGTATTLIGTGDGASVEGDAPDGLGTDAQVFSPVSPLATEDGDVYWIDGGSGILRRLRLDGVADCPLEPGCAVASFPAGNAFSLTQTRSGVLYAMDATAGKLYRVTP